MPPASRLRRRKNHLDEPAGRSITGGLVACRNRRGDAMTTPDDHECYPVPRFVTVPGRSAFDDDVHCHARELAAELDDEAAREINAGRSPEQTADTADSSSRLPESARRS